MGPTLISRMHFMSDGSFRAARGTYLPAVHDVETDRILDAPRLPVPTGAVLLVDGIFLHRDELRDVWDESVFLDVPFDVSVPRMAGRDGLPDDPGAASTTAPTTGGAAPTLIVTTTIDDLDGGTCRTDGIDIPLPARLAHRIACTGAVQKIVFDRAGRIVQIGSPERLFTPAQRRAITARDGGCIIPGCLVPASQCEIHHVTEHAHGGPTHTDNGVLLCWWYHHRLDDNGWTIHMRKGVPHVAAPAWIDIHRTPRPVRHHTMATAPRKRRRPSRTAVAGARGTAPPTGGQAGREPDPTD